MADLKEITSANKTYTKEILFEDNRQLSELDCTAGIVALSVFTSLAISCLGFYKKCSYSVCALGIAALGLVAYFGLRFFKCKYVLISEIIKDPSFPQVHHFPVNFGPEVKNIPEVTLTLEELEKQIARDLTGGFHVYINGEKIESAKQIMKLYANDSVILDQMHQGAASHGTIRLTDFLKKYGDHGCTPRFEAHQLSHHNDKDNNLCSVEIYADISKDTKTVTLKNYWAVRDMSNDGKFVKGLVYEAITRVDVLKKTYTTELLRVPNASQLLASIR
ncbi:MAG: hypothetical protein H7A40_02185 [Chlamydiales bacterium]|nr:hypothetical protein [Chlamydiales bacterium]